MDKKSERRSFLGKLGLGIVALMAKPFVSKAQTIHEEIMEQNKINESKGSILKIKPMGFMWDTVDPFLFCVHHEDKFPRGNDEMGPAVSLAGRQLGDDFITKDGFRMYHGKKVPGFPGHPHRGFETITVVREGLVDHADSLGAAGRYGNGDVQWMTAGGGVQHSEMFPCLHKDKENPMELFQIWLNLPKKNKMVAPHFKMLWADTIPKYRYKDKSGKHTEVEVMAGKIGKHQAPVPPPDSWASDPNHEVSVWNIKIEAGGSWEIPKASAGINRTLYFYIGEHLSIDGQAISKYHAVEVRPENELSLKNGNSEARILLLQGRPINEPVIQYGPFVMNTKEEINQAFEDYHNTQFGGWPWPKTAQVHPREKGRFAKHADGRVEEKG